MKAVSLGEVVHIPQLFVESMTTFPTSVCQVVIATDYQLCLKIDTGAMPQLTLKSDARI